jgi:hypothetical protein
VAWEIWKQRNECFWEEETECPWRSSGC